MSADNDSYHTEQGWCYTGTDTPNVNQDTTLTISLNSETCAVLESDIYTYYQNHRHIFNETEQSHLEDMYARRNDHFSFLGALINICAENEYHRKYEKQTVKLQENVKGQAFAMMLQYLRNSETEIKATLQVKGNSQILHHAKIYYEDFKITCKDGHHIYIIQDHPAMDTNPVDEGVIIDKILSSQASYIPLLDKVSLVPTHPQNRKQEAQYHQMTGEITNFSFLLPPQEVINQYQEKQIFLEKGTITNTSNTEFSEEFSYEVNNQQEYSFSFEETLKIPIKIKATIPLVRKAEVEVSSKLGFEAGQVITDRQTTTTKVAKTITVGPHKSVSVTGYTSRVKGLEVPFTAILILSSPVDADAILSALKCSQFEGTIVGTERYRVLARVNGTFKGSYEVESVIAFVDT